MSRILQTMFDATVRIDEVIYIPGAIADEDAYSTRFKAFCEDFPEQSDAPLYVQCPPLAVFAEGDEWPDPYLVALALRGMNGFLFLAATPVRQWHDEQICDYSWGHYWTAWLYASGEAEIAPTAVKWAKKQSAVDRPLPPTQVAGN